MAATWSRSATPACSPRWFGRPSTRNSTAPPAGLPDHVAPDALLTHYLAVGAGRGLPPTPAFDERFYLAFYDDVRETIRGGPGTLTSGYEHDVVAGRREGRLPRHELSATLTTRFRGITDAVALARTNDLEEALRPPRVRPVARNERVLHVILPDLNPDIFFGGYQAIVALMTHLLRVGNRLAIIQSGRTVAGIEYFLYHQRDAEMRALFCAVPTFARSDEIEVGRNDRFLGYSVWDALIAAELVRHTDEPRFSFLIQEYERVALRRRRRPRRARRGGARRPAPAPPPGAAGAVRVRRAAEPGAVRAGAVRGDRRHQPLRQSRRRVRSRPTSSPPSRRSRRDQRRGGRGAGARRPGAREKRRAVRRHLVRDLGRRLRPVVDTLVRENLV